MQAFAKLTPNAIKMKDIGAIKLFIFKFLFQIPKKWFCKISTTLTYNQFTLMEYD